MPHEVVNHQIHLGWSFKLVDVANTYSLAVDDVPQPLRHEMRRIERRCGDEMEGGHLAIGRDGQAITSGDAMSSA